MKRVLFLTAILVMALTSYSWAGTTDSAAATVVIQQYLDVNWNEVTPPAFAPAPGNFTDQIVIDSSDVDVTANTNWTVGYTSMTIGGGAATFGIELSLDNQATWKVVGNNLGAGTPDPSGDVDFSITDWKLTGLDVNDPPGNYTGTVLMTIF